MFDAADIIPADNFNYLYTTAVVWVVAAKAHWLLALRDAEKNKRRK